MTGLDKIIDRILTDAKEDARKILETAQNDCRLTAEKYAARAEEIRTEIEEQTEAEGAAIIAKAKSAAVMTRRNILLTARAELIDRTFEAAKADIRDTDYGKYRALLSALLTSALIEEAKNTDASLSLGDEVTEFERYEVLFNAEDREKYGEAVIEDARRAVTRHIGAARAARLTLSNEIADIDGGLLLRYGNITANCSLSMLMAQMRAEMEQKVVGILFIDNPIAD